jgi:hypothetical protein
MRHLNELIRATAVALSFSGAANAAELMIFDSLNMIVLNDGAGLTGYYGSIEGDKNCEFFSIRLERRRSLRRGILNVV